MATKMKVVDLKRELKSRNLSTVGTKIESLERLKAATECPEDVLAGVEWEPTSLESHDDTSADAALPDISLTLAGGMAHTGLLDASETECPRTPDRPYPGIEVSQDMPFFTAPESTTATVPLVRSAEVDIDQNLTSFIETITGLKAKANGVPESHRRGKRIHAATMLLNARLKQLCKSIKARFIDLSRELTSKGAMQKDGLQYGEEGILFVILVQLTDSERNMCFVFSVLAGLHPVYSKRSRASCYREHLTKYWFTTRYPVTFPQDVQAFERKNAVSVNVYGYNREQRFVYPLKVNDSEREKHVDLLLIDDHFVLITNFAGLFANSRSHRFRCERLLAASTVPQKHVVQLPRIVLYIRRVQVAPTVLVGIERRLQFSPATYLLRGVEIKTRTVSPGVSHIVLDDLYPHRVPSKLLVAFVKSEAFQGSREHDPFKLEHFNLKTAVLDVGGCQQTEQFDFAQDLYMKAYMSFQHRLNRRDIPYSKGAFSKDSFLLYYILTPDREEQILCPISTANVRLTLTFKQDLTKAITILFMSETPRVLEIDKERNVKFAG
ncbi:hypothetical protein ISCGN_001997 [Ixodes scapularis]